MAQKKGRLLSYGIPEGDTPASRSYYDNERRLAVSRQAEAEQIAIDTAETEAEIKQYGAPIGSPKWYEMWEEKHRRSAMRTELADIDDQINWLNSQGSYEMDTQRKGLQNRRADIINQISGAKIVPQAESKTAPSLPFKGGGSTGLPEGTYQYDKGGNLKQITKPTTVKERAMDHITKKRVDHLTKLLAGEDVVVPPKEELPKGETLPVSRSANYEERTKAEIELQQIGRKHSPPEIRQQDFMEWYQELSELLGLESDYRNETTVDYFGMFMEGYSPIKAHYDRFLNKGVESNNTKTGNDKKKADPLGIR